METVGIAYQDLLPTNDQNMHILQIGKAEDSTSTRTKKRRSYEFIDLNLEPYHKKPKIRSPIFLPLSDERRSYVPPYLATSRLLDNLWMLSLYLLPDETPMCVGWNSQIKNNENDVSQKVYYLPQINYTVQYSPYKDVEMNKDEICVTYDLPIAKIALQIQAEESPRFDNTSVFIGPFHTEAAHFHAVGIFEAESDGPSILIACDILASGSLKGFIMASITIDANEYILC